MHVDDWAKATRDPCPRVNCNIQVSVTKYFGPRLAIFACIFTCVEVAIEERKAREREKERQLLCKLTSFAHLLSCLLFFSSPSLSLSLSLSLWLQATMSMSLILLFSLTQGHLVCFWFETRMDCLLLAFAFLLLGVTIQFSL